MYDPYFLTILMREREREILEEIRRGGYHARRRLGSFGLSKKIAHRLHATFLRLKALAAPRRSHQQATDGKEGYESWQKEFS